MTRDEILQPMILSYWDSHQFENYLHEEGEYVKLEDAEKAMIEYAKLKCIEQRKVCQTLRDAEMNGIIDAVIGPIYFNAPEPKFD